MSRECNVDLDSRACEGSNNEMAAKAKFETVHLIMAYGNSAAWKIQL